MSFFNLYPFDDNEFSYSERWIDGKSQGDNRSVSLQQRFLYYSKNATAHGAFLGVSELLERFLMTARKDVTDRHKSRLKAYLCLNAKRFGLMTFYGKGARGDKLYVSSESCTYFSTEFNKANKFVYALKGDLLGASGMPVAVYQSIRSRSKMSQACLERLIKKLKSKAQVLGLYFFKKGRVLYVRLRSKKLSKNTHQNPDIAFYRDKRAKDLKRNTPDGGIRFSLKMKGKCFWLTRQLRSCFYDNIKVNFSFGIAYNFVKWALLQGFKADDIRGYFDEALIQRHKDATDTGLNQGCPTFKYELSSTVSLARERLLASDSRTAEDRWRALGKVLIQHDETNAIAGQPDCLCENWDFGHLGSVQANPVETKLCWQNTAQDQGFSKSQMAIFERFLEGRLANEMVCLNGRLIVNMSRRLQHVLKLRLIDIIKK